MTKLVNRAKMTTATTGTGAITLGSAVDGYQSFADAGVADADVVRYVIEDGNNWEIGTGTYTASGTTLSRTVSESSNADAAISLSGDAVVYLSATADDFISIKTVNTVVLTSSGTYTPPESLLYAEVILTGGGGGGGGADCSDTSAGSAGGGGGSGGTVIATLTKTDLGSSVTCTVGSGGSGGPTTGGNGTDGGSTIFSLPAGDLFAQGGFGGYGAATSILYMGVGGSRGFYSIPAALTSKAYPVEGGFGDSGFVGDQTTYHAKGGAGGSSYWGGGAYGASDDSGFKYGQLGRVYGSGGGGAVSVRSTTGGLGGSGASGVIVIREYLA